MRPLIAIVGNTGVGKSQLAVEIARQLSGEVINADVMQMYRGANVITNKPTLEEMKGVVHHFLNTENWSDLLTVQDFNSKASKIVSDLNNGNKLPVVVGGTHYYIQSLIAENLVVNNLKKPFTKQQLEILADPVLVEKELSRVDKVVMEKFHPNDTRRLRRALEIFYETGRKPSEIYDEQQQNLALKYRVLVFWVWCDQDVLNTRLDERVDKMIDNGLVNEIKELYTAYNGKMEGIFQSIGFRQFLPYLENNTKENFDLGVEAMKQETRQYAKKQRKWIKNKLSPFINQLGGDFAIVDSTDLNKFDENVTKRAVSIVQKWLTNKHNELDLVPDYLKSETVRTRTDFDKSQWTRHNCEVCSKLKNFNVTLIGDDDWAVHLRSKSHRSASRRLKRREEKTSVG